MDVSDRSLQAKLTQEAKITSASFLSEVIFAFGGFINALRPPVVRGLGLSKEGLAKLCFASRFFGGIGWVLRAYHAENSTLCTISSMRAP